MRIVIKTKVSENYKTVFKKFDRNLFLALKPPLIQLNLEKFDGCFTGDKVELSLGLFGIVQKWKALIVEQNESQDEIYFIDEGKELPAPIKQWRHRHGLENIEDKATIIVDDINYSSNNKVIDFLLYPILYLQFWYRKPVYRRYFSK